MKQEQRSAFANLKTENISIPHLKMIVHQEMLKVLVEYHKKTNSNKTNDGDEYITMTELASMLHIKRDTCKSYNHQRKIPFVKCGRHPMYKKSDVIAYMERIRVMSDEEIKACAKK